MKRQGSIYTSQKTQKPSLSLSQHEHPPPSKWFLSSFPSTPKSCCPSPTSKFFSSSTPVTKSTSASTYFTPASTTLSSSSRTYASTLRASPSSISTVTNHGRYYDKRICDFDDAIGSSIHDDIEEEMILDPPVPIAKARSHSFRPIITPRPSRLSNSYWTSIQDLTGTRTTTHYKNTHQETIASAFSVAADIIKKSSISITSKKTTATIATATATTTAPPPPSPIHCKKNLVKTEFCKYIINNEVCKFGSFCNFAHSKEELNYKTLFERHDAGLLDKNTLRTRPCFDFVSTGSW
jgi:hypothetical protein